MNTFSRVLFLSLSLSLPFVSSFVLLQYPATSACDAPYNIILSSRLPLRFPPHPALHPSTNEARRARSLLVLPFAMSSSISPPLFARHASRLILPLHRVAADRSHILGRGISKLETRQENQPGDRILVL